MEEIDNNSTVMFRLSNFADAQTAYYTLRQLLAFGADHLSHGDSEYIGVRPFLEHGVSMVDKVVRWEVFPGFDPIGEDGYDGDTEEMSENRSPKLVFDPSVFQDYESLVEELARLCYLGVVHKYYLPNGKALFATLETSFWMIQERLRAERMEDTDTDMDTDTDDEYEADWLSEDEFESGYSSASSGMTILN